MFFYVFVLQLNQDKSRLLSSSSGCCWVSAWLWSASLFSQETEGEFSHTEKIQYIEYICSFCSSARLHDITENLTVLIICARLDRGIEMSWLCFSIYPARQIWPCFKTQIF